MESEIQLGSVAGLRMSARPSFFTAHLLLMAILALIGRLLLKLSRPQALLGALIATALDPLAILIHQLGHAWAAQRSGWPMVGISFWSLFSTCIYPPDEPELPAAVHVRRGVAGPVLSFLNGVVTGAFALKVLPRRGLPRLLALLWIANAAVLRGIMAFGPVSFSDGPNLRYWMKRL